MLINVTGKDKALEDLEAAKRLIDEAGKILWRLPSDIKVEINEGSQDVTEVAQDSR